MNNQGASAATSGQSSSNNSIPGVSNRGIITKISNITTLPALDLAKFQHVTLSLKTYTNSGNVVVNSSCYENYGNANCLVVKGGKVENYGNIGSVVLEKGTLNNYGNINVVYIKFGTSLKNFGKIANLYRIQTEATSTSNAAKNGNSILQRNIAFLQSNAGRVNINNPIFNMQFTNCVIRGLFINQNTQNLPNTLAASLRNTATSTQNRPNTSTESRAVATATVTSAQNLPSTSATSRLDNATSAQIQPGEQNNSDSDFEEIPQEIETIDLCTQVPETNLPAGKGPQTSNRPNYRAVPYERLSNKSNGVRCPICFRSAKDHEPVSTLCGHVYCKNCITASLQSRYEKKCPMCKEKLPRDKPFHRVYL